MTKKVTQKDRAQPRFSDLVGVDFASTGTKVVRLKQAKGSITLTGMDLLPPVDLTAAPTRLQLSRSMSANYGCLAYTGKQAVVRMINTSASGNSERLPEQKLRELLNVNEEYRVSAQLIKKGNGKQDSSFLAAAIPEADVEHLVGLFPVGPPAPSSLEVSGLSFVSAFLNARGEEVADSTVCLMECGENLSHFSFLAKGRVMLVGKMSFGARLLREKLAEDLGLDEELAASILSDASVNVSSTIASILIPFIKQLSISKDFIERHQGSRISRIYVSGGLSLLPSLNTEIGRLLGTQVATWSPLENISYDQAALPEELVRQATRFSAAIGAAIGGLEDQ
jgi:Tfp pilus assembly PilM family ATPase